MTADDRELLTVKVMRLSQPQCDIQLWPLIPLDDITAQAESEGACISTPIEDDTLLRSHALLLPITQGKVFSGETFAAYVNITNSSQIQAVSVALQVELVVGKTRSTLFDNADSPVSVLNPGDSFDQNVKKQLLESGTYMLVCTVTHQTGLHGDHKSFRKSFQFTAASPFDVSHRIVHLEGKCLLECSLTNVSRQSIFVQDASVICPEGIRCVREECSTHISRMRGNGIHNFKPKDVLSLVFSVMPTLATEKQARSLRTVTDFGRLALEWRTVSGGTGTSTSYVFTNEGEALLPLELRLISVPSSVKVCQPFTVDFEVVNRLDSASEVVVTVSFAELEPFFVGGSSEKKIGVVSGHSTIRFCMEMLCMKPGFHRLRGIFINALGSERRTSINPSCEVLAL